MNSTAYSRFPRESQSVRNETDYLPERDDRLFEELISPDDKPGSTDDTDDNFGNNGTAPVHIDPITESIKPYSVCSPNYRQLQLWEGRVDSVGVDSFMATISDRTDPTLPDESVEISLDELGEVHRARVKIGALFVWSIAYEDAGSGRRTISEIRFRRPRKWTKQSLRAVQETRELIDSVIGSD